MARGSSKSSGSTRNRQGGASRSARGKAEADTTAADNVETTTDSLAAAADEALAKAEEGVTDAAESLSEGDATPPAEDTPTEAEAATDTDIADAERPAADTAGAAGDDSVTGAETDSPDGDMDTVSTGGDESVTLIPDADEVASTPDAAPEAAPPPVPPAPPPAPERRGGFVPLLLGGVIAAGVGYGAAYMGWLPTAGGPDDQSAAIAAALENQSAALSALEARVSEIGAAAPAAAPEVDLSPVLEQIAGLSERIDGAATGISTLAERVSVLEDRPVFTGDLDEDNAAATEAAAELEAELAAQREAAEARAAALQSAAAEAEAAAEAAAAEAADAVARAEAEAAEAVARAEAEAALNALRAAFETGAPYAEPLDAISAATEVPEVLGAMADSGVPTLEGLQAAFPPLARAALPVALRETAGEGVGDRLGAFVMGQIGGRSVEPREGDDPDAVLSRVEAAVRSGDLPAALSEITALPEGAQAVLAPWVADVEARAAAEEGLAALTAALTGNGN